MRHAFTPFTPSVTELPHLAILSGSTTPFVRHEFSTRSSLSSTIHCASLASLFIPLPLPFFPFSSFSRRNNEMWKNGSSLLKSEHRPRSLLCLLFPFRSRGRRKMASGEYTLTGMEISLPLSSFSFLPQEDVSLSPLSFSVFPSLSFFRQVVVTKQLVFLFEQVVDECVSSFFVLYRIMKVGVILCTLDQQ